MKTRPRWFIAQQEMLLAIPLIVVLAALFIVPWVIVAVASGVLIFGAWCFLAVRVARTSVVIGPDALQFRDIWRSGVIPWRDVRTVEVVRSRPFPPVQVQTFTVVRVSTADDGSQDLFGTCLLSAKQRDALAEAFGQHARQGHHAESLIKKKLTSALQAAPRSGRV